MTKAKEPKKLKKPQVEKVEEILKPKKNFSLKLTKPDLVHLRDLFGVLLPADMKATVSQALAASQGRHLIETKLWNKISDLCSEAGIPLGDESPDFIVTMTAPPQLSVFEMISESNDHVEEQLPRGLETILQGDKT